jgi:signal peptidase II
MKSTQAALVILIILVIDQWSKFYIKTHFALHDSVVVFSWFKIYFIENEGMAWGAKIPGHYGKLILTVFRLLAIVGIGYWLCEVIRKQASWVLTLSIALIFAGAMGNIIDSVFYGVFFEHSMGQVAQFLPDGGGYGKWLHGKVVDMFSFSFFNPVFNVADTAISTGVGLLVLFNKKAFPKGQKQEQI